MAGRNRLSLIGYLGADPQMRYTPDGKAVTSFSIGVSGRKNKQTGEKETQWFEIACWERLAEIANEYCVKGTLVLVEGPIRAETWEDKSGKTRVTLKVNASEVQILSSRSDQAKPASAGYVDGEMPF